MQLLQSSAAAKSLDSAKAGGDAQLRRTQGPRALRGDAPGRGVASAARPQARAAPLQAARGCSSPRRAATTRAALLPSSTKERQRHTCLGDAAARHCRRTRSSAWVHAPCATAGGRSAAAAPALHSVAASGRCCCTGASARSMQPPSSCGVLSACAGFRSSTGAGGAGPHWAAGGTQRTNSSF